MRQESIEKPLIMNVLADIIMLIYLCVLVYDYFIH